MQVNRTKLTLFSRSWLLGVVLFSICLVPLRAQDCGFSPVFYNQTISQIPWDDFEPFSLPFTLIYGGPIENGNVAAPLTHGFSHIGNTNFLGSVPRDQRAIIYYGTAITGTNQPWESIRSPWENDLSLYQQKWQNDFRNLATATGSTTDIAADILVFDIERNWRFDFEIAQLRANPLISATYRNLGEQEFLSSYKRDMRTLYAQSVQQLLSYQPVGTLKVGSYADSPIVNTFDNIQGRSWTSWQSDNSSLNYITTDLNRNVGGAFYDQLTMANPSAYYYYDYPHPFAGEYLSYLLFQIEANKSWTDKPVIPFVWLRYSFNQDVVDRPIKPWMAEATAIFPFFSGANGLWLWENPTKLGETDLAANYGAFLSGMRRLAFFKRFFEDDVKLVQEVSARDYNENKMPIWRGAVKGNEILIAAHNPFAKSETEQVMLEVRYGDWSKNITLTGFENHLCAYDMNDKTSILQTFPNPTSGSLKLRFDSGAYTTASVRLIGPAGQDIDQFQLAFLENTSVTEEIVLPTTGYSWIFLEMTLGDSRIIKRIAQD